MSWNKHYEESFEKHSGVLTAKQIYQATGETILDFYADGIITEEDMIDRLRVLRDIYNRVRTLIF